MNIVHQTNYIIRSCKEEYIESANKIVPGLNIPKELSNKSYAEIMQTIAMRFLQINPKRSLYPLFATLAIYCLDKHNCKFSENTEIYEFYKSIFDNITKIANEFI